MDATPPRASPASSGSMATPSSSRPSLAVTGSLHTPTPSSSSSSSERLFTPFKEMISGGEGSRTAGAASAGLVAMKDILEAVDTLPFVKYLASVGVQLLQYVIEMQITNDMFRNLAFRAKDVIVAVARSCDGLQSMAVQLESDLLQLTSTMDNILSFATEKASRGTLRKLWNKSEDAAMVKALDKQLTHAFHIFQIQSDVTSRRQQDLMMKQLADLSVSPPIPSRTDLIINRPLHVQEGVYLIKNGASGKILEIEDFKPYGHVQAVHVYMAPEPNDPSQSQLWLIQRHANKDFNYTVRSLATGYVLDTVFNSNENGAKVGGYPWGPGSGNEIWSFWGNRQGLGTSSDYCTIRSTGLPTVLDGSCPRNSLRCGDLHATLITNTGPTFSQEWQLIPVSSTPSGPASAIQYPNGVSVFPRRQLLLQNVHTGKYASRTESTNGPNVTLTASPSSNSSWSFLYIDNYRQDRFAILSASHSFTVDHWGGSYINVARYRPENPYHKWTATPRDGFFIFRNNFTDALLAARSDVVDTLPLNARDNPACHWRLIDAVTHEHVRILCDSALSILPPDLAGSATDPAPIPRAPISKSLSLWTGDASSEMQRALVNSFRREHATIRAMLQEGYKAIVYAPRVIAGWREGEVKTVWIVDDDAEFKWNWNNRFEACTPT